MYPHRLGNQGEGTRHRLDLGTTGQSEERPGGIRCGTGCDALLGTADETPVGTHVDQDGKAATFLPAKQRQIRTARNAYRHRLSDQPRSPPRTQKACHGRRLLVALERFRYRIDSPPCQTLTGQLSSLPQQTDHRGASTGTSPNGASPVNSQSLSPEPRSKDSASANANCD